MDGIRQQVRHAFWRMATGQFCVAWAWALFAALWCAAAAIGFGKFFPLVVSDWQIMAIAAAVATLGAALWTLWKRPRMSDAAQELDRRFELRERVSSALALDASTLASPAGRALVDDANRRLDGLAVAERFRFRLDRRVLLPLLPAAVATGLLLLIGPSAGSSKLQASTQSPEQKQVKAAAAQLSKRLARQKQEAREKGLPEAEALLERLERGAVDMQKVGELDSKRAMVELNQLARDLEKRREQLGGAQKLQQQLNQLRSMERGPADKLGQAMRAGDFEQARNELKELQKALEEGKLNEEEKKALARQLAQVEEKVSRIAEAHREAQAELERQIAEAQRTGDTAKAGELSEKLDQLRKQNSRVEQLQKMAQKFGKAGKCLSEGKAGEACQALAGAEGDLEELADQSGELESLEAALDEVAAAKEAMHCGECQGAGCGACRGDGHGRGLGPGRGEGERPEEKTDTGFFDSRVKQQVGRGSAVVTGMVDGPNAQGEVQSTINQQFEEAASDDADPLTGHRLPPRYRDHAQKYFELLREGK